MLGNSVSRACDEDGVSSSITDSEEGGTFHRPLLMVEGGASSVITDRDKHVASRHESQYSISKEAIGVDLASADVIRGP